VAPLHPGLISPVGLTAILVFSLAIRTNLAHSEGFAPTRVDPDPPARTNPPAPVETGHRPSWDLDGLHVWLGPVGAASHVDGVWDSTVGGDLTVVRIRERELLGAIGASLGASRWSERGGGRIWLDAVAGTRLGRMIGVSAGPLIELADVQPPRLGGSVGVWAFLGVTPYARVGTVEELGVFAEVGVHIALPVRRWGRWH